MRSNGGFGGPICILSRWNRPMKSENQIIIRWKQPNWIKIYKTLQSLLPFCYSVGERHILQTVLLSFFWSCYFLNALQRGDDSNVLGINIFWLGLGFGPFSEVILDFNPRLTARAKMSHINAYEHKLINIKQIWFLSADFWYQPVIPRQLFIKVQTLQKKNLDTKRTNFILKNLRQ